VEITVIQHSTAKAVVLRTQAPNQSGRVANWIAAR